MNAKIAKISAGGTSVGAFSNLFKSNFLALSSGVSTAEAFRRKIELIRAPVLPYQRVNEQTGVTQMDSDSTKVTFVEKVEIPADLGSETYDIKRAEVRFLNQLKISSPNKYVVAKGDSLWSISERTYGDGKVFTILEQLNGIRSGRVRVGQEIELITLSDLCEQDNKRHVVRPGDTVWGLKKEVPGLQPKAKDFRSRRLSLIYPYELFRFQN